MRRTIPVPSRLFRQQQIHRRASPDNLAEFEKEQKAAGTSERTRNLFNASGKWASKLYLADMEMNLRTPNYGEDSSSSTSRTIPARAPPLWESSTRLWNPGIISPEEWRRSCAPLTNPCRVPEVLFHRGRGSNRACKSFKLHQQQACRVSDRLEPPFSTTDA